MWTPLGLMGQTVYDTGEDRVVLSGTNVVAKPEHQLLVKMKELVLVEGAVLGHRAATESNWYGLELEVGRLEVDAKSRVDAGGVGYLPGRTSGNSSVGGATGPSGGSYGGLGGYGNTGEPNRVYGDYRNPDEPGAGAGPYYPGGAGGGLIRITAETVVLEGGIVANGADGNDGWHYGAGSGGGILLNVGTLSGGGRIAADGGLAYGIGGAGGGGRVAVYYWDACSLLSDHVQALGGQRGNSIGQNGSVFISDSPLFYWSGNEDWLVHGTCELHWMALGIDHSRTSARIVLHGFGNPQILLENQPASGGFSWNSETVPDGCYEIRAVFYDATGRILGEGARFLRVNNAADFHAGRIATSQTWSPQTVHIVEQTVVVVAGATLTISPGAVVKFSPQTSIVLENGAKLIANGTEAQVTVLTALADDTNGGDSNMDGVSTSPRAGAWLGVETAGSDAFTCNEFTDIRYLVTEHQGVLTTSATWLGNLLHRVVNDVVIPSGVTLTIGPGAIVKLDLGKSITVQSGGVLIVQGQAAMPVQFTSIRDDTLGGDTNGDGSQSSPAAGDWRWLSLEGSTGTFEYCLLRYGGGPQEGGWGPSGGPGKSVIKTSGNASLQFLQSQVVDGFYDGILAWGGSAKLVNSIFVGLDRAICAHPFSTVEVLNCTLHDNRIGLLVHGGTLDAANTIVAASLESGVQYDFGTLRSLTHCDVWMPTNAAGLNYRDTPDLTGEMGNISVDPKFKNPAKLNFRLNYVSPCIDAADGTKAPTADWMGAPRYDDPRSPNTGLPTAFGNYADIGACEFVESALSDVDVVVAAVAGPTVAVAGETVWIEWTIQNVGTGEVKGPWHDAVYLVQADNQQPVPAQEVLVGQGVTLGPGQTYRARAEIRVPGGIMTDYRWQVVANSRGEIFEGEQSANNAGVSAIITSLSLPELPIGGAPLEGHFTTAGEAQWYYLRPTSSKDVQIFLDLAGVEGLTELYLGKEFMPSLTQFDVRQMEKNSADSTVFISDATTNTYYLLVYARAMPGGQSPFHLHAAEVDLSVTKIVPDTVGNAGQVTVEIVGAGMRPGTRLSLVAAGGQRREAVRTRIFSSGKTFATFDLTGFPVGMADIEADQQGGVILGKSALQVTSGGTGQFYASVSGPPNLRLGRSGTWFLTYGNKGSIDVPLPWLRFTVAGAQDIKLFDSTVNWADSLVLLALNDQSLMPALGPGQEVTVQLEVKPGAAATATAVLDVLPGDVATRDNTPFAWQSIPVPPGVDPVLWQQELATLDNRLGRTAADHYALLMRDLEQIANDDLGNEYIVNINGQWLFGPEPLGAFTFEPPMLVDDDSGEAVSFVHKLGAEKLPANGITNTFFVLIMNAQYHGTNDLPYKSNDFRDYMQYLQQDLRVPTNQIRALHDEIGVTGDTIRRTNVLNAIAGLRGVIDADDNLVIVYSGHGGRSTNGMGYICPSGGSVSARHLQAAITEAGPGTTYIINNSCHAAAVVDNMQLDRVVGLSSTVADRFTLGARKSSPFITLLKSNLRRCYGLQESFDLARTAIETRYRNETNVTHRVKPQLTNRSSLDLSGKPWTDPTGFRQRLRQQLLRLGFNLLQSIISNLLGSIDPNDKIGPGGVGSEHYVGPSDWLPYTIRFENVTNATAPAQEVLVVDSLDPNLDWDTLELTGIGFNTVKLVIPSGFQNYFILTNVQTDPYPVAGEGIFDATSGTLTWKIQSVDPITGGLPEDPFAGFLPPNDSSRRGEGYVSYIVRPRSGLANGTVIRNVATITFDPAYGANPPILTPVVQHTIDSLAPVSAVVPMTAQSPRDIEVKWSGQDSGEGSGIANYDVYVSREAGSYQPWLLAVTNTVALFSGEPGVTYAWFSLARDRAGNVQPVPTLPHAWTTTEFYITGISAKPSGSGPGAVTDVVIAWQSAADKRYNVWWTSDLQAPFTKIAEGILATPPENSFTHSATAVGPGYYRIEVVP
jgi:hypothetical protein